MKFDKNKIMEYTETELLKFLNDVKFKHENLKKELIYFTEEIENLENKINEGLKELEISEKNYIAIIEEIDKRSNVKQ